MMRASRRPMISLKPLLLCACGMLLAACENFGQKPEFLAPAAPGTPTTELVERDVEAPQVFQVTENGLWDGRPSLGGVWVAHPTVGDPERVIVRNPANDKFVVGALFRKETNLPGPDLQVSSDAAAALGLVAGQPQILNVTALRKENVPDPDAAAPASSVPAPLGVDSTPLPAATPAPAETAAPANASPLARPYIQVGTFAVQANANEVADRLIAAGIPARVRSDTANGKPVWGVLAGPANSRAAFDELLTKVKAQGFSDAYAVKG